MFFKLFLPILIAGVQNWLRLGSLTELNCWNICPGLEVMEDTRTLRHSSDHLPSVANLLLSPPAPAFHSALSRPWSDCSAGVCTHHLATRLLQRYSSQSSGINFGTTAMSTQCHGPFGDEPWTTWSCDAGPVRASLATNPVQTLPSCTSCNRRSIPTLYLGAGDPCRRYPGPCLTVLGGQTRTRRFENKAGLLWESFWGSGTEGVEQASSRHQINPRHWTVQEAAQASRLSYSALHTPYLASKRAIVYHRLTVFCM